MSDVELCEGCETPLGIVDMMGGWRVCLDCTQARARSAMTSRCHCGARQREGMLHETHPGRDAGRKWFTCLRCLGTTRQIR